MPKDSSNKRIRIKIRLNGPKSSEHEFKFQQHSSIQKISNIFCESLDLCLDDVKFYHRGCLLDDTDTILSLNMKDGDTIQVMETNLHVLPVLADPNHIKLKVLVSADSAIEFKTLRNEPLKKLMDVFCARRNILRRNTNFLYDGICIKDENTPLTLNMDDGDTIEVVNMFGNSMVEKPTRDKKYIILRVKGQDNSIVRFRVLRDDPLRKLMSSYCEHLLIGIHDIRFIFDGHHILNKDTPTLLEMENNDMIECFQQVSCG